MAASSVWVPRPRDYELENRQWKSKTEPAANHPLKAIVVSASLGSSKGQPGGSGGSSRKTSTSSKPVSSSPLDPLSSLVGSDPLSDNVTSNDPLSLLVTEQRVKEKEELLLGRDRRSSSVVSQEDFEEWNDKKSSILSKYTTSEKLSIATSFLSASKHQGGASRQPGPGTAAPSSVSDKVKNRLEQLDDFDEGSLQEMLNLTQQDYMKRIDELNQALTLAWERDQKVKALKIVIQCAKLLADVSVIQFYPSKFVLVTDVLDNFGRLVYQRLHERSTSGSSMKSLPANFSPDDVSEVAKETCRNWFYKVASIRELIPRMYVEASLLKCYRFIGRRLIDEGLERLTRSSRGIGHPLVGLYARCYMCRMGIKVGSKNEAHRRQAFDDFVDTFAQLRSDSVQDVLAAQSVEMPRFLTLFSPPLDWILQCVAMKGSSSDSPLTGIMEQYSKQASSGLLLQSMIQSFRSDSVSARAVEFSELIRDCSDDIYPKHLLYCSLGTKVVAKAPPDDQLLPLLNETWKFITKLKNPQEYISCSDIWIEFIAKNFGKREINTVLGDLIKHMTPDRAFEDFYPQLTSILKKILQNHHDFSTLFSTEKFMSFIDLFQKESVKTEICKIILNAFTDFQTETTSDPIIINSIMFLSRTLHDSVNALTLDDDRREASRVLCLFIRLVSFGKDFEQQLSFYVEARASFTNLDPVIATLVQCVNNLAITTRKIVRGNHTKKTMVFVRACAAYCYITIPSLDGVMSQLDLYLVSGQVAILNKCLSQGDAFFKAAISLLNTVPSHYEQDRKQRSSENYLFQYIQNFLSTLVTVPDNPDQGVLYLFKGLVNTVATYSWDREGAKYELFMSMLSCLSAISQDIYIYHIDQVDANDALYGHDVKFISEVNQVASTLLKEILGYLQDLGKDAGGRKLQSSMTFKLFECVITHGDLERDEVSALTSQLWGLAHQNGQMDIKLSSKSLRSMTAKGGVHKQVAVAIRPAEAGSWE